MAEFFANITLPQATFLGVLITGAMIPVLNLLLNKLFNKKNDKADYGAKLQKMTEDAIDQLAQERDARAKESESWEKKYAALEVRMRDVEHIQSGPYILYSETEFNTLPQPTVIRQTHKLELAPAKTV